MITVVIDFLGGPFYFFPPIPLILRIRGKEREEKTCEGFGTCVEVPPSIDRSTPERRINGGG